VLNRTVCALIAVASCLEADAYRMEFITTVDGERLSGSEVCLYAAAGVSDPVSTFFASDAVHCLPADEIIDVPSGSWAFYARHEDGWISAHGSALSRRGFSMPGTGYRAIVIELEPAAHVHFDGTSRADRFAAYVPIRGDPRHAPIGLPLPSSEDSIMVPARRPFVIMRLRENKPFAVGPLTTLGPGKIVDADAVIPSDSQRDVIAWVRIAPSSLHALSQAEAPRVRLLDEDENEVHPLYEIAGAGSAHQSLVVFRQLTAVDVVLRLDGDDWKPVDRALTLPEEGGLFIEQPLEARLRQRLSVRWVLPIARELITAHSGCETDVENRMDWVVELAKCFAAEPGTPHDPCRPEREERISPDEDSVEFDLLRSGAYRVSLRAGQIELQTGQVNLKEDRDLEIVLRPELSTFFGRVTAGGEPLRAVLKFRTGSAVTDHAGEYHTVLQHPPGLNNIEIVPCDGSPLFEHIPREPLSASGRYDIDVPENRIDVTVVSATGRELLPAARIARGLFATEPDAQEASLLGHLVLDEQGKVILTRLQPGYFLRVCGAAEGFEARCADPLRIDEDTRAEIELALERRSIYRGRLTGLDTSAGALLFRTSSDGRIVESLLVEGDGRFFYTGEIHADYLVVVAINHPLFVVPHPRSETDQTMEIAVPAGAIRHFTVEIGETRQEQSGWFTIGMANAVIPMSALSAHVTRRGLTTEIVAGRKSAVVDILETGPLYVVAAFGVFPLPEPIADLFARPEYRGALQIRPVPPDGRVVFE
jgi:hypothetical protein